MLKRLGGTQAPRVAMSDAAFPAPFASGLEYSAPARGTWTIVHVGMLLPEAHEIFVCAAGCLRGVVLSAAEMNLTGRFSTVAIEEHNVLNGDMEQLLIEGVSDVLNRLPQLPRAVLVYSSCIHHFMGCDLAMCYRVLRERFPTVDFTDCYMIPTMRKSGLTPDQIMRRQLYSLIRPTPAQERTCAILGNCFSMEAQSDLVALIQRAGWTVLQIPDCQSYEQYQQMGQSTLFLTTQPVAKEGGRALAQRLEREHLYVPVSYGAQEIRAHLTALAQELGTEYDGGYAQEQAANEALAQAAQVIGNTPIAIDYTVTSRPLGLARLLLEHGFCVDTLFLDSFSAEEKEDYQWLRDHAPDVMVYPTVHAGMRKLVRESQGKTLALGQKAAFFTNSAHFVNLVENGGLYGFSGIARMAQLMIDAFREEKDTARLIQEKGLGCESCI